MVIFLRKAHERGMGEHGWLHSKHTFSFANYYDIEHMGFRSLRVLNEDIVEPENGFGTHGHRNMEIFSYMISGTLAHKDNVGNERTIMPGWVQFMSAGSGVQHSEYNGSKTEPVHFIQVWIVPEIKDTQPYYEDRFFGDQIDKGEWVLLLAKNPTGNALAIKQDVNVLAARPKAGSSLEYRMRQGRGAWVQVVEGQLVVNNTLVETGDGISIEYAPTIEIHAQTDAEILLFDLA